MTCPIWFGLHYPEWADLMDHADKLGVPVVENQAPRPAYLAKDSGGPLIVIPEGLPSLARHWALAHELGHARQHAGPIPRAKGRQECQANRWAACALIPEARIMLHQNACLDSMIAALSAHYEDIPPIDCPSRTLAARIGRYRLQALQTTRGEIHDA